MISKRSHGSSISSCRLAAARARQRGASLFLLGFFSVLSFSPSPLWANPTGSSVVAGTAAITQSGSTLNVVNSNGAIINWQSFSIGAGETTNFLQPGAFSSVLNRVTGGSLSAIYGTLASNGKVFLINPNGVMIGAGGTINTAGFTASTLDVANTAFTQYALGGGQLQFLGNSTAKVENLGTINAAGGDIFLIARQVHNGGLLNAPQGTVGLYASNEVYLSTGQADAGSVLVTAARLPGGLLATGVDNSGVIQAVRAELKATGNMYALAVNNTGAIRATGATVGQHGVVHFLGLGGTIRNTGTITAQDAGGQGGSIETSGEQVELGGTILTGLGGQWLIDPATLNIDTAAAATVVAALNGGTNILEQATSDLTVNSALAWSSTGTLTLQSGNTIEINSAITALNGGLTLNAGGKISAVAAVGVNTFTLQSGSWVQNTASLPVFHAANFVLNGGTFLRVLGGSGASGNPYQLADVYGLQGAGGFLSKSFLLANDIDASGTAKWNGGAGFAPIGNTTTAYTGTFDGGGHTINNLAINRPTQDNTGLFGDVGSGGEIENVGLLNAAIAGQNNVGALVGNLSGLVNYAYVTGTVNGSGNGVGGLVGVSGGSVDHSYSSAAVTGVDAVGGLVGSLYGGGVDVEFSYADGAVNGRNDVGGLVGEINYGTVDTSYALGAVTGTGDAVGGLVGYSGSGVIQYSYATGHVTGAGAVGGLVGHFDSDSGGYLTGNYWDTTASGTMVGVGDYAAAASEAKGMTTADMMTPSQYTNWTGSQAVSIDGSSGTWYIAGTASTSTAGQTYPILQSEYSATVTSSHQLELIGMNSTTLAASYTLANDIDLANDPLFGAYVAGVPTAGGFAPIGNFGLDGVSTFTGIFDGAGHVIRNLTINLPGQDEVGLFGQVGQSGMSGLVENLGLVNVKVTGHDIVGGLEGENDFSTVSHSYVTGTVTGTGDYVGGLVGGSYGDVDDTSVYVQYSYSTAAVTGNSNVGGLVGIGFDSTIEYSYATGAVNGADTVGGLVGSADYTVTDHSYALGAVTATGNDVGGLVGYSGSAIIRYSYATGHVTGAGVVGGLVGHLDFGDGGSLTANYWDMTASGTTVGVGDATNSEVIGLSTADMMNPSKYTEWTGSNAVSIDGASGSWYIAGTASTGTAGQSYPILQSEYSSTTIVNSHQLELIGMNSTTLGGSYTLASDIDLANDPIFGPYSSGVPTYGGFAPIGDFALNSASTFTGTFDGAGHTISHLSIDLPQNSVGLFGYIDSGATVRDLVLSDAAVLAGDDTGVLAGWNYGTVFNVSASGTASGGTTVGGLVGYNDGTIGASHAAVAVTATVSDGATASAGGLVGDNEGTLTLDGATGNVSLVNVGTGDFDNNLAGGLAGLNTGAISESYATGDVSISVPEGAINGYYNYNYAGGLVGGDGQEDISLAGGTITLSYATGQVSDLATSDSTNRTGGLVGYEGGALSNSYATGNVVDRVGDFGLVGGLVGHSTGTITQVYATGTVTTTASATPINGTPYTSRVGGLVGVNGGAVNEGVWNSAMAVGVNGGTVSHTAALTPAQMTVSSNYDSSWNFNPGTGTWGVNGYTGSTQINGGLPYFQWQHPTQWAVEPFDAAHVTTNLTVVQGHAINQADYGIVSTDGTYPDGFISNVLLTSDGSSVGTHQVTVSATVSDGYTVEFLGGTETITPAPAPVSSSAVISTLVAKLNDTTTSSIVSNSHINPATDTGGADGGTGATVGTGSNGDAANGNTSTGGGKKNGTLGSTPTTASASGTPGVAGNEAVVSPGGKYSVGSMNPGGINIPPPSFVVAHFNQVLGPGVRNQLQQALRP